MAGVGLATAAIGDIGLWLVGQTGFVPTGPEQAAVLACKKRFILNEGGEQGGKSLLGAKTLIKRLPESETEALYWLVGRDYGKTRAEFDYLVEDFGKLGLSKKVSTRVDPGEIVLKDGTRILTKSAEDPRDLAMEAPNGAVVCEASQLGIESFNRLNSRVAPKRAWMYLGGTPERGFPWFDQLAKAWSSGVGDAQSFGLPSWTNIHLYPGGRNDPEILRLERASSDEFFMERIAGRPAPPRGVVFGEFRPDIHIKDVEYNPDLPIYIWEDPGYGHAHAIEIAQKQPGGQVAVQDEIYERGIITEDLIHLCTQQPWWKNPNKKLVIDPNYKSQHHATRSIEDIWLAKTGLVAHGSKVRIAEGIERFKGFLKIDPVSHEPGIVFSPKCKGILSELGAYLDPFDGQSRVWVWQTGKDGGIVGAEPEDRWNDGCKAVIYGLVEEFGLVNTSGSRQLIMQRHGGERSNPSDSVLAGWRR